MTILATKLFVPPPSAQTVLRSSLIGRLDAGLSRKLSLICAPAGFGKSTLLSSWVDACQYPSAWLSLDENDRHPTQFLTYLIAALQTISETVGAGIGEMLRASPPASAESVLTVLLNNLSASRSKLVLVLDDYHLAASDPVDAALAFLLDHLPPQMHLVMATRDEPNIPLARLRVDRQLTEIRQDDLRFGLDDAARFLNQTMLLNVSSHHIAALDNRTEGWIAGLQLVAISLQGHKDHETFVQSFNGSHHFIQDYLLEQVLSQQTERMQSFLLCTSVFDRFCGPLCDAVLESDDGHKNLNSLIQANLFIVPLDNEKRWYRYHHLFADLLRQRLPRHCQASALHIRASQWYEANGMEIDAFHQAAAGMDIARAMRLIDGNGLPLYFRGEMVTAIQWLQSQSPATLDAHPALWVKFAWTLLMSGQFSQLGPTLSGAEAALRKAADAPEVTDLQGQIAVLWAWLAVPKNEMDSIHTHATRALALLHPSNFPARTAAQCALGVALLFRNDRVRAGTAFADVINAGKASGNLMFTAVASIALAGIHATDNALFPAATIYRDVIAMITDPANTVGWQAHLGLARILYEWNDLDGADAHAQQSLRLSQRQEQDSSAAEALRARVLLARDDSDGAITLLAQVRQAEKSGRTARKMPEVAIVQILTMLHRSEVGTAAHLATQLQLPMAMARTLLAQGDNKAALALLEQHRLAMESNDQPHEVLKVMVLQAIALDAMGQRMQSLAILVDALTVAEPGGFVRIFLDEGTSMELLLSKVSIQGAMADYVSKLLSIFALNASMHHRDTLPAVSPAPAPPPETYSQRELAILRLIHQGRSNQEIGEQLFLSLSTVKWHNQNIFAKLQVQRRTEAVARALTLNLIAH